MNSAPITLSSPYPAASVTAGVQMHHVPHPHAHARHHHPHFNYALYPDADIQRRAEEIIQFGGAGPSNP
jgi:nuclear transcription factor Y alpha